MSAYSRNRAGIAGAAAVLAAACLAACNTGTESAPENPKRLFVTSSMHTGDLGGLAGADSICAARAAAAGLDGDWKAFLSDSLTTAADRAPASDSWRLVDGKTEVFGSNAGFTGAARVSVHDEYGNPVAGGRAWTGVRADGGPYPGHQCAGWTSASQNLFGASGEPVRIPQDHGPRWMHASGTPRCATEARLYCMEH